MTVDKNVAAGSWVGSKYDPQERRDPKIDPLVLHQIWPDRINTAFVLLRRMKHVCKIDNGAVMEKPGSLCNCKSLIEKGSTSPASGKRLQAPRSNVP